MLAILIRHARAADRDDRRYTEDGQRPLLPEGRIEHERTAAALARMTLPVAHLVASPLTRARQTAEITARALGIAPERISFRPELGTDCSRGSLMQVLQFYPEDAVVALVGHEPCLSFFASEMLHPSGSVRVHFPTSGMLGLAFDGPPRAGRGELLFFLHPRAFVTPG